MIDPHEQTEIPHDLYCQQCGYNLRGLTGDICPECGKSLESLRSQVSQIPWVHRKEIGRFRAYWKTVWWMNRSYKTYSEEIARPVSYRDAQSFRWVTVLIAWCCALTWMIWWCVYVWPGPVQSSPGIGTWFVLEAMPDLGVILNEQFRYLWPQVVFMVCVLLYLLAITAIPSFFLSRQVMVDQVLNRAVSLSYYCCAPLAWTPAIIAFWVLGFVMPQDRFHNPTILGGFFVTVALALCAFLIVQLGGRPLKMVWNLMPNHRGRAVLMIVVTPIIWVVLLPLIFGTVFFLISFVTLFLSSVG